MCEANIHLYLVPKLIMRRLYLYSTIHLHSTVLDPLSTGITFYVASTSGEYLLRPARYIIGYVKDLKTEHSIT
jgi:hypothetical protein